MTSELHSPHRPAGPDLLRIARQTFEMALLPTLSGEHRYAALMVKRALEICEREWRDPPRRDSRQLDRPMAPSRFGDLPPVVEPLTEDEWAALAQAVKARLFVDTGDEPGGAT